MLNDCLIQELKKWINENDKLPKNVKNFAKEWVNEGLKDWIMTRDMNWGIPVPLEDSEGKVLFSEYAYMIPETEEYTTVEVTEKQLKSILEFFDDYKLQLDDSD